MVKRADTKHLWQSKEQTFLNLFLFCVNVKEPTHPLRDSNLIEKKSNPPSFWILLTRICSHMQDLDKSCIR